MALYAKLVVSVNEYSNLEPTKYAESICSTFGAHDHGARSIATSVITQVQQPPNVWVLTTPLCFGKTAPGTRDVEEVNKIQHQEEPRPGLARTVFHQTKSSIEECPGNSRLWGLEQGRGNANGDAGRVEPHISIESVRQSLLDRLAHLYSLCAESRIRNRESDNHFRHSSPSEKLGDGIHPLG